MDSVLTVLNANGATSVPDLGCGEEYPLLRLQTALQMCISVRSSGLFTRRPTSLQRVPLL
jgi:hypothetical protein